MVINTHLHYNPPITVYQKGTYGLYENNLSILRTHDFHFLFVFWLPVYAFGEDYPDLKASENFLYLKEQLSEVEDKIRFARQFYNDAVESYNTAVMSFPTNFFAGWFGFQEATFFKIDEAEKAIPQIKF